MNPYLDTLETIEKDLDTSLSAGLSQSEAKLRIEKSGPNKIKEKKKKSNFIRFIEQFKDVMIIILIIAAAISFVVACYEGHPKEFFEPILILLIVVLNAVMGVVQESKAEKALDALKNLSSPHAKVIRQGEKSVIDAADLVVGDVVLLEQGDFVPADGRIIESNSLKSEESALTGESLPVEKSADVVVDKGTSIADRKNMVFSGCSVTYGTAKIVVTATGMDTEMGKIADLLNKESKSETPLQKKLSGLGKNLGVLALIACAIIFVVGTLYGTPILEIFMMSVSLAVSAIPEGLPAIVTIVLAIGVQRMVKRNAIIRRLPAVETLGSASIICSDKTGTLTQNRMTLVKIYSESNGIEDVTNKNSEDACKILKYGTLCSDGTVLVKGKEEKHIGDPTETSIVFAALKNGMSKDDLEKKFPRISEIPFDSDRKLMTTVNKIDGKNVAIVKGAFDVLMSKCVKGDFEKASQTNKDMSSQALRVIAVAYKEIDSIPKNPKPEDLENNLTFLGLVGMIDPPRKEVKQAVKTCLNAGIKPVMITGDHVITASAIARELLILKDGDIAITGAELDAMSDDELDSKVKMISVYARVSPENKIRIVKAWQRQGKVVAMTGDGVNDAPALKAADIGCAMGITGTDVAKGAADMTLTDDNFATIVEAVKEGRGIYANIKKVVGFLLGTNIGEVFTVFFAMLIFRTSPLLSMQLLWINLVTDSLPAIALGMEDVERGIMNQSPKPKDEGIFAHGLGVRVVLQGLMFSVLTLIAFFVGMSEYQDSVAGQTMAFLVLSLSQVVQAFNMRSNQSLFKIGPFKNKKLNGAALCSILLIALALFTPLSVAFGLKYLSFKLYFIGLALSFVPLVVMEFSKAFGLIKHEEIFTPNVQ